MADPLAIKGFYAGLVTLTSTAQSIQTLLESIYASANKVPPPKMCVKELHLKADAGNTTNNCLIGDENVSTSNYGNQLTSSAADRGVVWGPFDMSAIPLQDIFAIASAGSPKMLIEVIP